MFKCGDDPDLTPDQRQAKLLAARPGYALAEDCDTQWRLLARKILNLALADARDYRYAYDVRLFAESDWCALLCEVAGIGWRPYAKAC